MHKTAATIISGINWFISQIAAIAIISPIGLSLTACAAPALTGPYYQPFYP